jgi:hypothetical protein
MWTQSLEPPSDEEGLSSIEAEFFTQHFIIHGQVTSPEMRLSDHLNSSTSTFELRPTRVQRAATGAQINVAGSCTYVSKAHLLFVLPSGQAQPDASDHNLWSRTLKQTCWAGIGHYSLIGKVHMEAGRNPRLFLRSLEQRQFLPFTEVRLTFPDGSLRELATVIVNRHHLELLALDGEPR